MEDTDKGHGNSPEGPHNDKKDANVNRETDNGHTRTSSRASMLSESSGRNSPEGQEADLVYNPVSVTLRSSSTEFLTQKNSTGSRFSGIEVNPLFDVNQKRRKSLTSRLFRQMSFVNNNEKSSPNICHKRMSKNFMASSGGIDDADGTLITKSEFLQKWREQPEKTVEPYNIDTEENVFHFLAREGKFDTLKELCEELKNGPYIYQALKCKDKFGQTPMLSAISAAENRNEILSFFLNLIHEKNTDVILQEVAILNCNKHNDSILTLLMKNNEVFRETMQLFFRIFSDYYTKGNAQSEGFYKLICQILLQNSCEANSKSISDIVRELHLVSPTFFQEGNKIFSYKNPHTRSNTLMELAKSAKDDALRELLVIRLTYRYYIQIR